MPVHNIHMYQQGNPDVTRHIAFCAYMRANPDEQREYVAVKRAAYTLHPTDVNAYNDAKDAYIKRVEKKAVEWYSKP